MPYVRLQNPPTLICDNCGAKYKPGRKMKPGERHFCQDNCRKEFHKRGGSFSKLKPEIIKEVRRQVKQRDPLDLTWQAGIEKRLSEIEQRLDRMRGAFSA